MALSLRTTFADLAPLLFFGFVYLKFGEIAVLLLSFVMALFLTGFSLARNFRIHVSSFMVYSVLSVVSINYILQGAWLDYLFPLLVPFFPFIAIHYFFTKRKMLPGSTGLFFMLLGFLASIAYNTINNHGVYEYDLIGDRTIFFAFLFFSVVCMLFAFRILSLWIMAVVITLSVLPEILYVLWLYVSHNSIGMLLSERFGSSVNIMPNQTAIWLDIALPLALFFALYDKRPLVKTSFSAVALLYGAVFLLSASRGSLAGLPLIIGCVVFKAKSVASKITIVAVIFALIGIFGRTVVERAFAPSRHDMVSTIGRIELLMTGYKVLEANHFIFGIGIDNFKTEKIKHGFPRGYDPGVAMSSHNGFLELWLGWGFFGFIGWLLFLGEGVVRAVRAKLRPEVSYIKPALLLAISMACVHLLFDSMVASMPYMVFFLSLVACTYYLGEGEDLRQPTKCQAISSGGTRPPLVVVPQKERF